MYFIFSDLLLNYVELNLVEGKNLPLGLNKLKKIKAFVGFKLIRKILFAFKKTKLIFFILN